MWKMQGCPMPVRGDVKLLRATFLSLLFSTGKPFFTSWEDGGWLWPNAHFFTQCIAEAWGTALIVLYGCGVVCAAVSTRTRYTIYKAICREWLACRLRDGSHTHLSALARRTGVYGCAGSNMASCSRMGHHC